MGYTIIVRADESILQPNPHSNKNKILFLEKTDTLTKMLPKLKGYPFISSTQEEEEEEGFSLETERPIQEFIDLLRDLNFLEQDSYQDIYEKLQLQRSAIKNNQLYDAVKEHIITDYCSSQIPYTTYSFIERCLRFLVALLTFPISIFRVYLVKEEEIGLALRSGKPEILPPGWHVMLAPTTEFIGIKKQDEPYVQHGTMQLVRVQEGQLGYAKDTEKGKHLFLKPGFHIIRSPTTKFIKFLNLNRQINELDPGQLVLIRTGTEGLVYDEGGRLVIKKPGVHLIIPPSKLEKITSTQDTIMELPECIYESCDYVPLNIKADVFYRISDTEKVYKKIASNSLEKYIRDTAIATLSSIIRNSTFKEIGQSSTPAYNTNSSTQQAPGASNSPPPYSFYSKVHDAFIQELQHHGIHQLGIDIFNIRIESLSIQDPQLAKSIYSQALLSAQIQTKLANVEAESKIQKATAQQQAETKLITAKADSEAITIEAQTKAAAIEIQAKAKATATEIQAKADAAATEITGEAQNQNLIGQWEALAKGGLAVKGNQTAEQAALIYASGKSLEKIQKIVYLPLEATKGLMGGLINSGIFNHQNSEEQKASVNFLPPSLT